MSKLWTFLALWLVSFVSSATVPPGYSYTGGIQGHAFVSVSDTSLGTLTTLCQSQMTPVTGRTYLAAGAPVYVSSGPPPQSSSVCGYFNGSTFVQTGTAVQVISALSCPANSSGTSSCSCNAGYVEDGTHTSCVPQTVSCTAGQTVSSG